MTMSQSASLILNSRLSRVTPALLTSTTGGPSSAAIAVDGGLDLLGVADVGPDGQRLAPGGLDGGHRVGAVVGLQVEDGDGEAVLRQPLGGGRPDAPCGAGDDGDLAHVVLLFVRGIQATRSNTAARPCPPPMHIVSSP